MCLQQLVQQQCLPQAGQQSTSSVAGKCCCVMCLEVCLQAARKLHMLHDSCPSLVRRHPRRRESPVKTHLDLTVFVLQAVALLCSPTSALTFKCMSLSCKSARSSGSKSSRRATVSGSTSWACKATWLLTMKSRRSMFGYQADEVPDTLLAEFDFAIAQLFGQS